MATSRLKHVNLKYYNSLRDEYESWKLITNNRDNEMLKNIYNYSMNNEYKNAIFIIGSEHEKSILEKIEEFNKKYTIKINWEKLRIA